MAALVGVVLAVALAAPALAASASPRPPTIDGTVAGDLSPGDQLTYRVDAAAIGGWQNLHEIVASAISNGSTLETMTFKIEDNQLDVGDQDLPVGTGAVASDPYLRVNAAKVVVTTGGANLSISIIADVIKALPDNVRFRLQAVDDFGRTASLTRGLNVGTSTGLTWGTVALAVAVALFAGGFLGNVFASKRRPVARPSVYVAVQRRIDERRSGADTSPGR